MIQTNFKQNDITSLMSCALTLLKYPMYQFHIPIGEESDPNKLWTYDNPIINGYKSSVVKITDWDKTRSELANYVFNKASKNIYQVVVVQRKVVLSLVQKVVQTN